MESGEINKPKDDFLHMRNDSKFRVLTIGTERRILDESSEARKRIMEYGRLVGEMHIIILNQKSKIPEAEQTRCGAGKNQNFGNVFLYPTNSRSRWFYVFDAYKIARKIILNSEFLIRNSLMACQDPFECGLVGWLLKRKFKIPLQLQIHTDFLSPYFRKESLLNKIRAMLAKFLILRADCVRVVSGRIKKSLVINGYALADKISVLPIFVDVKKIQAASARIDLRKKYPQFDFIILMASRLTVEKNIGLAIEAMAEIVKKYPKTGLIIAGDGPEKENLKFKIKNFPPEADQPRAEKLENNIILEPWTDDLVSYYKTADLFLLTSNYEGYGMAVIEAMAAGCPVIMTDVGLANEVLIDKKDGLIIPVGDKEKLIEAVSNLTTDPGLRADLVKNSQKTMSFWLKKDDYLKAYSASWLSCGKS